MLVQPETVVRWHRAGFKMYWRWISRRRARPGRKPTPRALRELIFRVVAENPTWGAPRIHGELKMLGYEISERTVVRWMRKAPPESRAGETLGNVSQQPSRGHRRDGLLHRAHAHLWNAVLLLRHRARPQANSSLQRDKTPDRRMVVQQLREAFSYDSAPRRLIFDRGADFNEEVIETITSFGIQPKQANFQSP